MSEIQLQLRFDDGHQQRYFSDRASLLRCVLRVAAQSPDPRFEIWAPGEPIRMRDGSEAGRRYELQEVLDLNHEAERDRILAEIATLDRAKGAVKE